MADVLFVAAREPMAPEPNLKTLRDVLLDAADFEAAAEGVLRLMLRSCDAAIEVSGLRGRVLRGMVHLRPEGAYRSLVVVDHDSDSSGIGGDALLPSATVWSLVERDRVLTEVDVKLGRATPLGREPVELRRPDVRTEDVFASRHRLLERSATHILAVPLRTRGQRCEGMISLELEARSVIGRTLTSHDGCNALGTLAEELQIVADLAAPSLVSLPLSATHHGEVRPDALLPVVGRSMQSRIKLLRVFARQEETVLLCGPTGSGKSRLAEWCHSQSPRAGAPFESVDLLTKTDEMQMADLFGWRRGAFTGSVGDMEGVVARVEHGTLFIDEIDKLSLKAQGGLLRFLETRRYRRMGETGGDREADVRIIVGTNADLEALVEQGDFRQDLYYRINVLPVRLPSLRERKDEIAAWAQFMATRRHQASGLEGAVRLSASAGVTLTGCEWPGNLRQLDNVIRRAHVIAMGEREDLGTHGELEISAEHIERAMGFERGESHSHDLLEAMRRAARAMAAEALNRRDSSAPLNLDLADALRGLALIEGLRLCDGDKEETTRLYGKGNLLSGRNHHKMLRRELTRVYELYAALGHPIDRDDLAGLDD